MLPYVSYMVPMVVIAIFNLFKRHKKPEYKVEMHAFENGREVKLKPDSSAPDELPDFKELKFINTKIKPYEDIMVGFAVALNDKHSIDDEIKLLECKISAFEDLKTFCISNGFGSYFADAWGKPLRNMPEGTTYITKSVERLQYLKDNYLSLKNKESIRNAALPLLDADLFSFIVKNQPVLQTAIYKAFDEALKEDIKERLYFWDKEGRISRAKHGSTYMISI